MPRATLVRLLVTFALAATGMVGCGGGDGGGTSGAASGSNAEGTTDDPEACEKAIADELDRTIDEGRLLLPYRDGNTDAAIEMGVEEIKEERPAPNGAFSFWANTALASQRRPFRLGNETATEGPISASCATVCATQTPTLHDCPSPTLARCRRFAKTRRPTRTHRGSIGTGARRVGSLRRSASPT